MEILDCTLRDGGYYTRWDFSETLLLHYFDAMEALPVTMVEIGYRNHPCTGYYGRHYYTPISLIQQARKLMPSKQLALMLDEKSCPPADLRLLLESCKGLVHMFRIAVAPDRLENALLMAEVIKKFGFKVGINLMYASTITPSAPVLNLISRMDGLVDALSLVDSYGAIYPDQLTSLITICRNNTQVALGFHGHNNIELAFANCLAALKAGCTIIDATVTGMGRGAGNLKTELLLTHLNKYSDLPVNFDVLSNVVNDFEKLRETYGWGTNLPYMVSGINSLPQKDVMDWVSKRYYSVQSIVRALHSHKDRHQERGKYPEFIPTEQCGRALIVGGGLSVKEHIDAVLTLVNRNPDICIIHASSKNAQWFSGVSNRQYYCLVGNEGQRLELAFKNLGNWNGDCILPPYPRKMGTFIPDAAQRRTYELPPPDKQLSNRDSHTSLAIQTAMALHVNEVYIIGYDGYDGLAISNREQDLIDENNTLFRYAAEHFNTFKALTATRYNIQDQASVYQFTI
jgi:4-hydroxy 2-oxovalerate aldolase